MLLYYLIAILAALCWAIASLISADVTRRIGGLAFNRIRLFFVSIMLISFTFYLDTWGTINQEFLFTILLSNIGIKQLKQSSIESRLQTMPSMLFTSSALSAKPLTVSSDTFCSTVN